MKKLLVVCGPTASGKTSLGILLAKKFEGEIISADSRQVYQEMDIITGKDKESYDKILVWGLDLVKPNEEFSVAHWLRYAQKKLKEIWQRNKLPIIVGGTGFWIKTLLEPISTIGIPPDLKLRKKLEKLNVKQLQQMLKKTYPERMYRMNQSDRNNPRRLIRAIEIAKLKIENSMKIAKLKIENYLIIGLKASYGFLYQRIDNRVDERVKQGAFKEVEKLIKKGYAENLASMTGIGYKELLPFFPAERDHPLGDKVKKSKNEVIQAWKNSEHGYARRQMTWFKKMTGINWFDIEKTGYKEKVVKLVKSWYINIDGKN